MPDQPFSSELAPLVQAWLEGTLTLEETARLDGALTAQPALVAALLAELRTDAMLHECCAAAKPSTGPGTLLVFPLRAASTTGRQPGVPAATAAAPNAGGSFTRRRLVAALAVAAAIMLVVPLTWFRSIPAASIDAISGPVMIERNGAELPAGRGVELLPGDTLHTRAGARAEIVFRGEHTRLALDQRTRLTVRQLEGGKSFELRHGTVTANVDDQGAGRPVSFMTSRALLTVPGAQFKFAARYGATWLQVEKGRVNISHLSSDEPDPVTVSAGQFAVAAPGVILQPRPAIGGLDALSAPLEIDLEDGMATGIGGWEPIPGGIRPTELARFPDQRQLGGGWIDPKKPKPYSFYFLPLSIRGSFRLSAVIDVDAVTPDLDPEGNLNLWRFGFGLRYPHREISLRMNQRPEGGTLQTRVLKPEWRRYLAEPMLGQSEAPFNVTAGERYRLTWEVRRQSPTTVRLQGKIWPADAVEPGAWTVDTVVLDVEGDLGAVNLDTYRAICSFRDFKAELLP